MVQFIIGEKGKGKTKVLLENANKTITEANGNIVYIDKSSKNMYELNNKIRLIDASEYAIENRDQFLGFISGIISQDHDLEYMYLDNFLVNAKAGVADIESCAAKLDALSEAFKVNFVVSMSVVKADAPDTIKDKIIAEL